MAKFLKLYTVSDDTGNHRQVAYVKMITPLGKDKYSLSIFTMVETGDVPFMENDQFDTLEEFDEAFNRISEDDARELFKQD